MMLAVGEITSPEGVRTMLYSTSSQLTVVRYPKQEIIVDDVIYRP